MPGTGATSTIPSLVVQKVRLVVHSMGPVTEEAHLSQNHWSIYLLADGASSVRLNMASDPTPGQDNGIFTVTRYAYQITTSAVQAWDWPVAKSFTVGDVLQLIGSKGRHQYRMTPSGAGCRHWILTIGNDMSEAGLIGSSSALESLLSNNYSRGVPQLPLPILPGSFY